MMKNDIRIGFEFEFIVPSSHKLFPRMNTLMQVSQMRPSDLMNNFINPDGNNATEFLLQYGLKTRGRESHVYLGDADIIGFNPAKFILAQRLTPITGKWYIKGKNSIMDKTEIIQDMIDNVDLDDSVSVKSAISSLSRHQIYGYDEHNTGISSLIDNLLEFVSDRFTSFTGNKAIPLTEKWRTSSNDSISNVGKTKPNWYVTVEHGIGEVDNYDCDHGVEIITPPMHPDIAIPQLALTCKFLKHLNEEFPITVGTNCGVHINVSKTGLNKDDVSPTYFNLMMPVRQEQNKYNRIPESYIYPNAEETKIVIKKLSKYGYIGMDSLDDIKSLVYLIDTATEMNNTYNADFSPMLKYNYVEYRFAGGENYHHRINDLTDSIRTLVEFTDSYQHWHNNKKFRDTLESIMAECGVPDRAKHRIPHGLI